MPVKDTCVSRLKTSKAMRENALDVAVAYQGVFKRWIVCRWSESADLGALQCRSDLSRSVNATDLVTIGVQKVAQVHEAHVALARSRRIFRGSAAVRYCFVVEFL